jgi:threonine dehydratase
MTELMQAVQTGPTHADVAATARWLAGRVVHTPVLRSAVIDEIAGARLLLKAENLQLSGSYKMRGALRAVSRVAAEGAHTGVLAQSTGNHALAVAYAAREHGLAVTVVLPSDAPAAKADKAREYGARVVLGGATAEERHATVAKLQEQTGYAIIDAYDHPDVVAGQGTAALELLHDADAAGTPLDALVVPVGGGGGAAGACLAAEDRPVDVYGVEPVGCDSMARSLAAGSRQIVAPAQTLADGLRPSCVGRLPFDIVTGRIAGVVRVDDAAIAEAFRLILFHAKILVEPSGAAGLAGALRIAATGRYRTVGVLLTGGNVEPSTVARLVGSPPALLEDAAR